MRALSYIFVLLGSLLLSGCFSLSNQAQPQVLTVQRQIVAPFDAIQTNGRMDLVVKSHPTARHSVLQITATKEVLNTLHFGVEKDVLYIRNLDLAHWYPAPRIVLTLPGGTQMRYINAVENSSIDAGKINVPTTTIKAGRNSRVVVAGKTRFVQATASSNGNINIRNLRADEAVINTTDEARVDVWAQKSLYALAADTSNIYYYCYPTLFSRYMRNDAAVLHFTQAPEPLSDIPREEQDEIISTEYVTE